MRRRSMCALCLAALLLPELAPGQGAPALIARVFLNSDPIGAEVSDAYGKPLGRTPLILRLDDAGLQPGVKRSLRIRKPGYETVDVPILVPSEGVVRQTVTLLPLEAALRLGDFEGAVTYRLGYGALELYPEARDGVLSPGLRPRYPRQNLLDGIRIALPFFLGVSALLAAGDITAPRDYSLPISWELAASTLVSAGLFGADLWLSRDRARFLASVSPPPVDWLSTRSGAGEALAEAKSLIELGANREAAAVLDRLLSLYSDSIHAPEATFLLGRLALLDGDFASASRLFLRVVEELPAAEVYDKACKGLADARALQGDPAGALEALDRLVFLDPSYPPRIIELYRIQLRGTAVQEP